MGEIRVDAVKMQQLAKSITKEIPGVGICLLVFPFGDPGMSNYVSNANREDMIKVLRETADRLEKKQDFPTPNNN